jgi:predicted amino acid dehydrogenase
MNTFAFIIHALDVRDVARKYPLARYLPDSWVEAGLRLIKPNILSHVQIKSATGAEADGYFVACPTTSRQFLNDPPERSYRAIVAAGELGASVGAKIVGLGAYTSIAGDAGITVAERLDIGVTTGNSYTVATAVEGAMEASRLVGHDPRATSAAILGATGSIGRACALLLADQVGRLILVARSRERLEALAEEVRAQGSAAVDVSTDLPAALREADLVVAVTSALDAVVTPEALKPGAIVCDVARPRDVSRTVAEQRDDVLVIEGGAVEVPGRPAWPFNFGFPDGLAYACMAETMILALEGRFEDFSLGRELRLDQIREIAELATKHGFKLAGFRSFERMVDPMTIAGVRQAAERARAVV